MSIGSKESRERSQALCVGEADILPYSVCLTSSHITALIIALISSALHCDNVQGLAPAKQLAPLGQGT